MISRTPISRASISRAMITGAVLAIGFLSGATVRAQTATDATPNAEGRIIADRLCARCHAIDPGAASPVAQAPPLWRIGQRYPVENLAESMAEGMVTGHGPVVMPSFELDTASIDALLAYLAGIQQR